MFDWQLDCRLYDVGLRYTETNLRLTLNVGEIRKVDLHHIMYIWTLTILYYEYNMFGQNYDGSIQDT